MMDQGATKEKGNLHRNTLHAFVQDGHFLLSGGISRNVLDIKKQRTLYQVMRNQKGRVKHPMKAGRKRNCDDIPPCWCSDILGGP